ncbi:MAG: glycosyltransferase family 4 protein [Alphaproteobacteria bacterium]
MSRKLPQKKDRPHVLIICSGGLEEQSGGVGRLMLYVTEAWRRHGNGPEYSVIDARGPGSILWSPLHLIKALAQITLATIRGRASVLHVNISVRGSTIRKTFIIMLAALLRRPVILHLHDGHFESFYGGLPKVGRALLAKLFRYASKVIVLGKHWHGVVARDLNVPHEDIVMLYNAVPDPLQNSTGMSAPNDGPCNILFLGRLGPWKGIPTLIEALASPSLANLPWHATLAGDGEIDASRTQAQAAGLTDRIDFPGWVSSATAQGLLGQADILVLASQGEGLPMSVLEALAHRVAVIATPVGSIPELITNNSSGLLIPIGDSKALAVAIRNLVENPDERRRLAQAGRTLFEQQLNVETYAERLTDLYREVAHERATLRPADAPQSRA